MLNFIKLSLFKERHHNVMGGVIFNLSMCLYNNVVDFSHSILLFHVADVLIITLSKVRCWESTSNISNHLLVLSCHLIKD